MIVFQSDSQVVGETLSTLFSLIQASPIDSAIVLKNSGVNTLNYRAQTWTGTAWVDMGVSGSDFYNTLQANEVKLIEVESSNPRIQFVGNASGGAYLEVAVLRYHNRDSGGSFPLMSL
jgi:hypothetical protein